LLDSPLDIAIAANGDLYVADTGNAAIRRIAFDDGGRAVISTLTPASASVPPDPGGDDAGGGGGGGGGGAPFACFFMMLTMAAAARHMGNRKTNGHRECDSKRNQNQKE
jgi:hypothetical protein